jgi:hypothetical protein
MPRSIVLRRAVKDCRHCRIRIPAPDSKITSLPSSDGRGGRRTEYAVKWKDDTHPAANIAPAIIFLVHIAREIALQDHRAEIVAEEAAHRELALLLVAYNWRVQIRGIETHPSHLPLAEAVARRQINVGMKSGLHPLTGNVSETGTGHGDN